MKKAKIKWAHKNKIPVFLCNDSQVWATQGCPGRSG